MESGKFTILHISLYPRLQKTHLLLHILMVCPKSLKLSVPQLDHILKLIIRYHIVPRSELSQVEQHLTKSKHSVCVISSLHHPYCCKVPHSHS